MNAVEIEQAITDQRLSEQQRMKQQDATEPFFITEEIEAVMLAAGYEFEPLPIACTGRLRDVLERMGIPSLHCNWARSPTRSVYVGKLLAYLEGRAE